MTNWRAVLIGFLVGVVASLFAFALPVVGHLGAGFIAGLVAGVVAGGGLASGAWHGLLAGAFGGLVAAVALAAFVTLVGATVSGPGGALAGLGVFAIGAVVAVVFAVDSAIGGAIGGFLAD
jgi:hypothetical protein